MLTKIKSLIKYLIIFVMFILCLSLIKSITKIVGANQKLKDEEIKLETLKKENRDLVSELQLANSPQFIEKTQRDKLGLAKTGEIVVVMPDVNVIKSYAPRIEEEKSVLPAPNWQKWLKLFN